MAYGWSAKQMARVNARRARRGQEELLPGPVSEKYQSDYMSEYEKRNAEKPKRRFPETDEDETQVANLEEEKTPRLNEYAGGKFRMSEAETPRLAAGEEKTKAFQGRMLRERSMRGPRFIERSMGMMA